MARLKRSSPTLDKAMRRIAGMRSISPSLDFGNGLNLTEYDLQIQTLQTQLSNYNTLLSTLDEMGGKIHLIEQELNSRSEKMLMSVATHYGKNSLQYIQAGGTPRKRKASPASTTPNTTPTSKTAATNGSTLVP